jgi:hypothetical protein
MHPHFPFSVVEVLWTLTFAAQLVLLVVLLGRDRIQRFPWFTASIIVIALRVLVAKVLYSRLPPLTFNAVLITLGDAGVLAGIMVLVELARKGFRGAGRTAWIAGSVAVLAVGAAVLKYWGQWPEWKMLTSNPKLTALVFMQLADQKGELLVGVLAIELGILVVLFGRRYGAGWRSHTQRIVIGLSTASIAQLGVQGIWEIIVAHTKPTSRDQYEHVINLRDKISNVNSAVYVLVLIWWIACLWKDDPGEPKMLAAPAAAGAKSIAATVDEQASAASDQAEDETAGQTNDPAKLKQD